MKQRPPKGPRDRLRGGFFFYCYSCAMPALNTKHRQPIAAFWYTSIGLFLLAAIIFYFGFAAAVSEALNGAGTPHLGALIFLATLVATAVLVLYPILGYALYTYELTDHSITINSGIIFRQHETINFNRIQTIDNERGPILMLFGLTLLEIWTASPDQISVDGPRHPSPDATIYLKKDDAHRIREFMSRSSTDAL